MATGTASAGASRPPVFGPPVPGQPHNQNHHQGKAQHGQAGLLNQRQGTRTKAQADQVALIQPVGVQGR